MGRAVWQYLLVCVALGLLGLGGQVGAQSPEGYARADIEYGLTVYRRECATCHGDSGDAVPSVDLRSGQLRRGASDRELRALLRTGIPDTGMPPADLDTSELAGIIAYLRNMNFEADAVTLGDAARGRVVFEGPGDCMQCHRVKGQGPRAAPDLTAIGTIRAPSTLQRSILDPTGSMRPIDRPVQVVTADGTRITGRRLNEDTYTLQLIDEQARLRSFDKADLREFTVLTESPMPSYADQLSAQELADLLAYLVSLKG
jgi:cytochrome c oxidase cbb3-type subunit 3